MNEQEQIAEGGWGVDPTFLLLVLRSDHAPSEAFVLTSTTHTRAVKTAPPVARDPSQRHPVTRTHTHLDVPVGQQQIHDYVGGEQLHAVQSFLDAAQLLAERSAAEALPRRTDLVPDGLLEVLAVGTERDRKTQSEMMMLLFLLLCLFGQPAWR